MSASGGHRLARADEGEAAVPSRARRCGSRSAQAIVLGERADDPQLAGREREAQLQRERALHGGGRRRGVADDRDAGGRGDDDRRARQPRRAAAQRGGIRVIRRRP